MTGFALDPMCDSTTPNNVAKTRIGGMSFLASASTMLAGYVEQEVDESGGLAAVAVQPLIALVSSCAASMFIPEPAWTRLTTFSPSASVDRTSK